MNDRDKQIADYNDAYQILNQAHNALIIDGAPYELRAKVVRAKMYIDMRQGELLSQSTWIKDAAHCLKEYYQYSEEMRSIGRGFRPTGLLGHSVETVIYNIEQLA